MIYQITSVVQLVSQLAFGTIIQVNKFCGTTEKIETTNAQLMQKKLSGSLPSLGWTKLEHENQLESCLLLFFSFGMIVFVAADAAVCHCCCC